MRALIDAMDALFDPRAFALGMIALINPCGFALLPAYLGFFLGQGVRFCCFFVLGPGLGLGFRGGFRFGRGGFVKLALKTRAPIVPLAVVGLLAFILPVVPLFLPSHVTMERSLETRVPPGA